jgi:hypothetical protein
MQENGDKAFFRGPAGIELKLYNRSAEPKNQR